MTVLSRKPAAGRTAFSLVELLVVILIITILFGLTAVSRADNLYASACTASNGSFALYLTGSGYGNANSADGWLYVGYADGSWLDGGRIAIADGHELPIRIVPLSAPRRAREIGPDARQRWAAATRSGFDGRRQ